MAGIGHARLSAMHALSNVVVGYDGTMLSESALKSAVRRTQLAGRTVLHVVCVVTDAGEAVRLPSGETMHRWMALESLRHIVQASTREDRARKKNLRIVAHILEGTPAWTIVEFAYRNHATEIVLGAHGGRDWGAPLGGVAREALTLSDIPVRVETGFSIPTRRGPPGNPTERTWSLGQSLLGPRLPAWRFVARA